MGKRPAPLAGADGLGVAAWARRAPGSYVVAPGTLPRVSDPAQLPQSSGLLPGSRSPSGYGESPALLHWPAGRGRLAFDILVLMSWKEDHVVLSSLGCPPPGPGSVPWGPGGCLRTLLVVLDPWGQEVQRAEVHWDVTSLAARGLPLPLWALESASAPFCNSQWSPQEVGDPLPPPLGMTLLSKV